MNSHVRHRLMPMILILAVLFGCSHQRPPADRTFEDEKNSLEALHLDLIARLIEGGNPRAGLAHLDAIETEDAEPAITFLRAEALRRVGRDVEAETQYQLLERTNYAGPANRGLGLMYARQGKILRAIERLRVARDLDPTDAKTRNDLGYALLRTRQYEEAGLELSTAVELAGEDSPPVRNLILLYVLLNRSQEVDWWAARAAIDPRELARIRDQASRMSGEFKEMNNESDATQPL